MLKTFLREFGSFCWNRATRCRFVSCTSMKKSNGFWVVQAMFKNAVWPNLCDMMCYSAVVHPLQASVCWVFRDSLLHTLVLTSGWVVVAFLSAGSRLAIFISSLTSARTFYPNNCHSLDVFSFFGPFCINPWYGCYGTSFRNIQTSTLTQKTMSHSK